MAGMTTLQKILISGLLLLFLVSLTQSEDPTILNSTKSELSLDFSLRNQTLLRKSNQEVDAASQSALKNDGERKIPFHLNKTELIIDKVKSNDITTVKTFKEFDDQVIINKTDSPLEYLFERLISNPQKLDSDLRLKDDYEEVNDSIDDTKELTTAKSIENDTDDGLISLANDTNVNIDAVKKETGDDVIINKSFKLFKQNLTKPFPKSQIEILRNLTSSKVLKMENPLKERKFNETINTKNLAIVNLEEKKINEERMKKNTTVGFEKVENITKVNTLTPKGRTISLISDEFSSEKQSIDSIKENLEIKFPKIEQPLSNKDSIVPKKSTNEIFKSDMIIEPSNTIDENVLESNSNISKINETNLLEVINKTIDSKIKDLNEFTDKNNTNKFDSKSNIFDNSSGLNIESTNIDREGNIENSILKVSTLNLNDKNNSTPVIISTTLSSLNPDITSSSSTLVFDKSLNTTVEDNVDETTLIPVTTSTVLQTFLINKISSQNKSSEREIELETTSLSSTIQYDFVGITEDGSFDNEFNNNNSTNKNPLNNILAIEDQLDTETSTINNNLTEINLDFETTSVDIDGFDLTTKFNVSEELTSTISDLTTTTNSYFDESTTIFQDNTSIYSNINNSSPELSTTSSELTTIESNTEFMLSYSTVDTLNVTNFVYTTDFTDNETTVTTPIINHTTSFTTTNVKYTTTPPTTTPTTTTTITAIIVQRFSPEEVSLPLRITVKGTWNDICPHLFSFRDSLAKLLSNGIKKVVSSEQIVFKKNICMEKNYYFKESLQAEIYTDIYLCVVDDNGNYDDPMTRILPTLYNNVKSNFNSSLEIVSIEFQNVESNNVIAVVIISCIAFICLVLLASLLFIMRKRQKRFNYGERCRPVSLDAYSLDSVSAYNSVRNKDITRTSKHSYGNPTFEDSSAIPSHPLNFVALTSFCNDITAIYEEFTNIPQVSTSIDELPPGAEVKNRYANVIPLPETRVPLMKIDNNPLSEYINANYVRGPKNATKYYIACQAPMESTVSDFWRMIWEQQSKVIIMLTDLVENGSEKCAEYLPPSEVTDCHRVYGNYQVTLMKCETKKKYVISTLQLKNLENSTCREVSHIWYLWPSNQSETDGASVIAILLEARALQRGGPGSIVVHCSPGTGRSGTLIALDLGIRQYEIIRTVDIPRVVYTIRRDRAGAVQTKEQYAFIYEALNLYATKLAGGSLESV